MGRKVVLVGLVLTLLGCTDDSGGDDAAPQPTTTQPSTTTEAPTTTAPDDEAQLRQLAEDWFDALRDVYVSGDRSALADFAADPYLAGVNSQIDDFESSGNGVEFSEDSRHETVEVTIDGDSATLVECVIDADRLLDPEGAVLNDSVQANLYETDATQGDGGWRLTERRILTEVDGSDQCPEQ